MTARVVHVSDLHIGSDDAQEPTGAAGTRRAIQPDLVLATGDVTERGRSGELERAAAKLRDLGLPLLAVPGNHDIPSTTCRDGTQALRRVGARVWTG